MRPESTCHQGKIPPLLLWTVADRHESTDAGPFACHFETNVLVCGRPCTRPRYDRQTSPRRGNAGRRQPRSKSSCSPAAKTASISFVPIPIAKTGTSPDRPWSGMMSATSCVTTAACCGRRQIRMMVSRPSIARKMRARPGSDVASYQKVNLPGTYPLDVKGRTAVSGRASCRLLLPQSGSAEEVASSQWAGTFSTPWTVPTATLRRWNHDG